MSEEKCWCFCREGAERPPSGGGEKSLETSLWWDHKTLCTRGHHLEMRGMLWNCQPEQKNIQHGNQVNVLFYKTTHKLLVTVGTVYRSKRRGDKPQTIKCFRNSVWAHLKIYFIPEHFLEFHINVLSFVLVSSQVWGLRTRAQRCFHSAKYNFLYVYIHEQPHLMVIYWISK